MDEYAVGSSSEGTSKSVNFDAARRMALKHIEAFVLNFSDPQVFAAAATSSAPASLALVVEAARIQEAGHLRCRSSFFLSYSAQQFHFKIGAEILSREDLFCMTNIMLHNLTVFSRIVCSHTSYLDYGIHIFINTASLTFPILVVDLSFQYL